MLLLLLPVAVPGAEFLGPGGKWVSLKHGPSFAWPTTPAIATHTEFSSSGEIGALLKEMIPDWNYEFPDLIQSRFVPMINGKVFLLVSEPNPKAEDGVLDAIYCQRNRCFYDTVPMLVDLENEIVDIDGDGVFQVVAKDCLGDCSGVFRMPVFSYSIYKFIDEKGFIDFSAQAGAYYREHLLPKVIAARDNEPSAAAQYAYDDYRRRVLGENEAGLENAIHWLDSERELGLEALAHIPSPAAEAKLQELLKSNDSALAERAESYLQLRKQLRARGVLK